MSIDDTIDFATLTSLCICIFGWILILATIPMIFINLKISEIMFISGIVVMSIGMLMALIIEPIFRLVYKYLSKKD